MVLSGGGAGQIVPLPESKGDPVPDPLSESSRLGVGGGGKTLCWVLPWLPNPRVSSYEFSTAPLGIVTPPGGLGGITEGGGDLGPGAGVEAIVENLAIIALTPCGSLPLTSGCGGSGLGFSVFILVCIAGRSLDLISLTATVSTRRCLLSFAGLACRCRGVMVGAPKIIVFLLFKWGYCANNFSFKSIKIQQVKG